VDHAVDIAGQIDVGEQHVNRPRSREMRQRVARVGNGVNLETIVDEHIDDQFTYEDFVLHHQHAPGRHAHVHG